VAARLDETHRTLQQLTEGNKKIIEIVSENKNLLIQNGQMFEQLNRSFTRLWNLEMARLYDKEIFKSIEMSLNIFDAALEATPAIPSIETAERLSPGHSRFRIRKFP